MATFDFQKQIEGTENRYGRRRGEAEALRKNQELGGDWRQVETPERLLQRMIGLGLRNLAANVMAREAVTEGVASAGPSPKKVNLLERIIEENDMVSSRFLHIGSSVACAVGKVLIRERSRTVGSGTGFLISPSLMMTNNHVLESRAVSGNSSIEFDFFERASGQSGPSELFDLDPDVFFMTDEGLDFTIVAVSNRGILGGNTADRAWIRLIAESGKALIGEPVNIIQHPGGRPQQIAIKNNKITDRVEDFLHYQTDTEPGSSGSPVFNLQWELAALHHSGVPERDDQKRILLRDGSAWDGSRATIDRISWIANEGVRISSIVKFVREALADQPGPQRDLFEEALGEVPEPERTVPISLVTSPERRSTTEIKLQLEGLKDEELDRLMPDQVAEIVASSEDLSLEVLEAAGRGKTLVAEGDSWFDYSLAGLDIIDCLRGFHGYRIHNVAEAGDTLNNMAWGTEYDERRWRRKRPPLQETLDAVRKYGPRVVLLSGGGNDIAGNELFSLLNHKDSGFDPIREDYANYVLKDYAQAAYEHIIKSIWKIDESIHIITHGYGYAVPDGRAVIRFFGFSFVGPWLRPPLTQMGYTGQSERQSIIDDLVNRFNAMLARLAASDPRIHYLDLRNDLGRQDWANELHLKNSAYKRVAAKFDDKIKQITLQS